jgi:hypothetical protein
MAVNQMLIMYDLSIHYWTNMIISRHKLKQAILSALADEEIVKILNCSMGMAINTGITMEINTTIVLMR